jgi:hypothetical protein
VVAYSAKKIKHLGFDTIFSSASHAPAKSLCVLQMFTAHSIVLQYSFEMIEGRVRRYGSDSLKCQQQDARERGCETKKSDCDEYFHRTEYITDSTSA